MLYRNIKGLKQPIQDIFSASDVDLTIGSGQNEIERFQNYLSATTLLCSVV